MDPGVFQELPSLKLVWVLDIVNKKFCETHTKCLLCFLSLFIFLNDFQQQRNRNIKSQIDHVTKLKSNKEGQKYK